MLVTARVRQLCALMSVVMVSVIDKVHCTKHQCYGSKIGVCTELFEGRLWKYRIYKSIVEQTSSLANLDRGSARKKSPTSMVMTNRMVENV